MKRFPYSLIILLMEIHEHKLTEEDEEMEAQTLYQFYLRKKRIVTEFRFLSMYGKIMPISPFHHSNAKKKNKSYYKYTERQISQTHTRTSIQSDKHNNSSICTILFFFLFLLLLFLLLLLSVCLCYYFT